MHFNFHLSGDETPEQTRRVANAVLALGGAQLVPDDEVNIKLDATPELMAFFNGQPDHPRKGPPTSTKAGEMHVEVNIDTTNATTALDKLAAHPGAKWVEEGAVTANVGESPSEYVPPHTSVTLPNCELPPAPSQFRAVYLDGVEVHSAVHPTPPTLSVAESTSRTTDKNGLPWDERIHSSSRAINADGTWRYRKNVPDETKQAVEAELSALMKQARALVKEPDDLVYLDQEALDRLHCNVKDIHGDASKHDIAPPPVAPVPPIPTAAPPVPTSTVQRSYSDVVNLIMANQATLNKPELYVAVLGMSLPEFAAACIAKPELATVAFNALDEIRRS